MAVFATEQKYFAIGFETARGTAVAPNKYIAVAKDSEFDYKLNLIPDELARGILEVFPSKAGTKEGTAKISNMDITGRNMGELLYSLMGKDTLGNLQETKTYLHTFSKDSTLLQNPSFTFHVSRGIDAKQYNLAVVKSIALKGAVDGKVSLDADILFQKEADETFDLTPKWEDPSPFMFYQTEIKFDDSADTTTVKEWNLMVDNGSVIQRVLNQSQNIKDVLTIGKLIISGGMTIYFDTEARRNKFLAATSQALKFTITGGIIEAALKYTLTINIPKAMYTAYPYGDADGLLAAAVTFEGKYDVATGKSIDITLLTDDCDYTVTAPTIASLDVPSGVDTGGTELTLTGTGFETGAVVYIGGTMCTAIIVVGPTHITCDSPAGTAGSAEIVVVNTNGGTGVLADGFTFISVPTITNLSAATGPEAGGTAETITGTDFADGMTVTFGGTSATSIVVVNSTHITCVTPAHAAGAVNVVITNMDTGTVTDNDGFTYTR
jgi:hypothetical protein